MIDDPRDRALAALSNVQALADDHIRLALHARQLEMALDQKNRDIAKMEKHIRFLQSGRKEVRTCDNGLGEDGSVRFP